MKYKTLGDIAKKISDTTFKMYSDPLAARARLYQTMSLYIMDARDYCTEEPYGDGTHELKDACDSAAVLINALIIDAKAHLDYERYTYLLKHEIREDALDVMPDAHAKGQLLDTLTYMWGAEDRFMSRLSGGLPSSYVKAVTGIKAQLRYLGKTIPDVIDSYYR